MPAILCKQINAKGKNIRFLELKKRLTLVFNILKVPLSLCKAKKIIFE